MYPDHLSSHIKFSVKRHLLPPVIGLVGAIIMFYGVSAALTGVAPNIPISIPVSAAVVNDSSYNPTNTAVKQYYLDIPAIDVSNVPVATVNIPTNEAVIVDQNYFRDYLRQGVVHYPGTALPSQDGNVVIFGHSSGYAWDSNKYKTVFAPLHDVNIGQKIVISGGQKDIVYDIKAKFIVSPDEVSVLDQHSNTKTITLITCTPIGTNDSRLIVQAEQTQ